MHGCNNSFAKRLGRFGVMRVVWHSIPIAYRLFVFPYCLSVYKTFLAESSNVDEVRARHIDLYHKSKVFRLLSA